MSFVYQLSANWFRYAPKSGKSPGWLSATPLVRNAIIRALVETDLDIDPQAHYILYPEKRDEGDQYGIGDSSLSDGVRSGDGLSSGFNKVVMEAGALSRSFSSGRDSSLQVRAHSYE
ncbi:hypothetical protein ACJJTC_000189 [Scirpophaga incertulas]